MRGFEDIRLLIVGPVAGEIHAAARLARAEGADVALADGPGDGLALLRTTAVGLVMIDVGCDVAGFMASLRAERFAVPVLACGIDAPAERAVAAIRAGARDYVPLPPHRALIAAALAAAATSVATDEPVGDDPALAAALGYARSLAPGRIAVLVAGERGTGKRHVARHLHAASGRTGLFLAIECAGVAPAIVETELFGGAEGELPARTGKIDQARGGTLFLRDVDRLAPATQARLARVIEDARSPDDARLVASTAEDLSELSREGMFRADLAARLAAARVALPPLCERAADIPALARHLLARQVEANGGGPRDIADDALAALAAYRWPGNVRELEDVIARAVAIARTGRIGCDDLVLVDGSRLCEVAGPARQGGEAGIDGLVGRTVEEVERALILKTLERCRGNRTSASGVLGISVRTMRNKLKTFVEAGIAVAPAA